MQQKMQQFLRTQYSTATEITANFANCAITNVRYQQPERYFIPNIIQFQIPFVLSWYQ